MCYGGEANIKVPSKNTAKEGKLGKVEDKKPERDKKEGKLLGRELQRGKKNPAGKGLKKKKKIAAGIEDSFRWRRD